jgi:sulfite exporter TauE/SafE
MISAIDLTPLFLLGFLGSGHCIGMCGPLVVAFPGQSGRFSAHLCYHGGRILTYVVIGAVMGALGGGWGALAHGQSVSAGLARFQVWLSLLVALVLLLLGLFRLGILREPGWLAPRPIPPSGQRAALFRGARSGRPGALFFVGLLMGNLPCGLSYAAFIRTLAAGGWTRGALQALAFGLGTLPGLLLVGTAFMGLLQRHRRLSDLIAGVVMVVMAVDVGADALGALF